MGSDNEANACTATVTEKEPKKYSCPFSECNHNCNRPWKLERHICSHTKERLFKCDHPGCEKDYTNKSHLVRHITTSHLKTNVTPVYISCPYPECFKQFQNKYSLKRHCKTHTNPNPFKCGDCDLIFKKRHQLVLHSYEHKGGLPFACGICGQRFSLKSELNQHERKHKKYTCEYFECQEVCLSWTLLRKHYKLKHARQYTCNFCGRSHLNKNSLTKHVLTHLPTSNHDVFPCPYKDCLKYYKYKSNLKHHILTCHEGKRFLCEEENCQRVFKSKNRLIDHVKRHEAGTLNAKRKPPTKCRKPRKDKGVTKKSTAASLSGIILPERVNRNLVQKCLSSGDEETIKKTLDALKEHSDVDGIDENSDVESNPIVEESKDGPVKTNLAFHSIRKIKRIRNC